MEHGVILRFVAARYTTAWGAVLSSLYPQLGRDEAAAAVISLRGSLHGNPWLEKVSKQLLEQPTCSLRINRKSNFGLDVTVQGIAGCQRGKTQDKTVKSKHYYQNMLGKEINALGRAMQQVFRKKEPLHPCWTRAQSGAWEGVPSLATAGG